MTAFKPIDGSKEDYRKYLDRKGVLDAITKALIKCNSDRPENAIEFIIENLGDKVKDRDTIARLQSDLNDARHEIDVLKRELTAVKLAATTSAVKIEQPVEQVKTEPIETEKPVASTETMPESKTSTVEQPEEQPAATTTATATTTTTEPEAEIKTDTVVEETAPVVPETTATQEETKTEEVAPSTPAQETPAAATTTE